MSVSTILDGSKSVATILIPAIQTGTLNATGAVSVNTLSSDGAVIAPIFTATQNANSTFVGSIVSSAQIVALGASSGSTLTATDNPTPTTNTGTASLTAGLASLGLLTSGSLGSVALPSTPNNLNISQFIIGDLRIVYGYAFNTTGGPLTTLPISFDSIPANTLPLQSQTGLFPIIGSSLWYSFTPVGSPFPTITSTSVTNNDITLNGTFANNSAVSFIAIGKAKF